MLHHFKTIGKSFDLFKYVNYGYNYTATHGSQIGLYNNVRLAMVQKEDLKINQKVIHGTCMYYVDINSS